MKRILSSLFVALTLLMVGGAFTTSCSNEILSTQQVDNTPHAFTIKLSAGFELPEIKELDSVPGTRATTETVNLIFQIKDSRDKKVTVDGGGNSSTPAKFAHLNRTLVVERYPTMKFLTVVRAKNRKDVVYYDYSEWKYDKATNCWIKEAISIPLSAGFALNDEIEVRLAAGGEITVADDQKSADIKVTPTIHQEVHFNTAEAQKMELPIPYISDWHDLAYDDNTTAMILASGRNNKIPVKPQGILMLATVRNNMSIPVTLGGIRFKSNALEYGGTFNLSGDNVQFTESNENLQVITARATKDVYKNVKIMFHQPLHLRAKMGTESDMALILTWAYSHTEKFRSRILDSGGDNVQKQSYGQLHVFAEDVLNNQEGSDKGKEVTKPNYAIVPIMGNVQPLKNGHSYTLNCELYDQPNLILGYFAKYTVNKTGTSFDSSHGHNDASLVNWKIAKEFLGNGKQLTTADGITAMYKMIPYSGAQNVVGAAYGGFGNFYGNTGFPAPYDGKLYVSGSGNGNRPTMHFNYNGYTFDANTAIQSYYNKANTRGYRLTNRWSLKTDKSDAIKRDLPQVAWRFEYKSVSGYLPYDRVSSIYLGKYFVGGLFTPIIDDLCLVDEELWLSEAGSRNIVQRRFPTPGWYSVVTEDDLDKVEPANTTREDPGKRTSYWAIATNRFRNNMIMGLLSQSRAHDNKTGLDWFFELKKLLKDDNSKMLLTGTSAPGNGGFNEQDERIRQLFFMPLITYSNVYQGDSAD